MHPYDIYLIVSVACVIGFTAVIHVEHDLRLALGHVAAAALGCPLGGWLGWRILPLQDQLAVIAGAFAGGGLLIVANLALQRRR